MNRLMMLLCLVLASCASDPQGLTVKQYHLREDMFDQNVDLMARGEVQRLLHGAVTVEERRQKIGQYYQVIWNQPGQASSSLEVVFEYLQAGSGSMVKRLVQRAPFHDRIDASFSIVGNDYRQNGRVLAWKVTIKEGGKTLASKQSYMWR
jgi:hypothetical protein